MRREQAVDEYGHYVYEYMPENAEELAVIQAGKSYIWGLCDAATLPIINLPPGTLKVRRRMRADEFATAILKCADGSTRRHYLVALPHELCIELGNETARNVTQAAP